MISGAFDYPAFRAVADKLIQQFGMIAVLRRITAVPTDRQCWAVVPQYMPKDADTQLANPTERTVLISAGLLGAFATPPDWEKDQLVTFVQPPALTPVVDEVLVFTEPVKPIRPAGITVLYEGRVRR